MTPIRCSVCPEGMLALREVARYDLGGLLGLPDVVIEGMTAPVCEHCGAVYPPGEMVERVLDEMAKYLVEKAPELAPVEVRFLRKYLGVTQSELAHRLGVNRVTVGRWETGDSPLARDISMPLRALVALHLVASSPALASELNHAFETPRTESPSRPFIVSAHALDTSPGL